MQPNIQVQNMQPFPPKNILLYIIMTSLINQTNKKFAVIIGINYVGTDSELNGCVNDANHVRTFLIDKAGYLPENIAMIADDNQHTAPTKQNILDSFALIVNKATNEGFTELWFSYSGHGSYITDYNGDEKDKQDEVICPVDYLVSGMITDDYIYDNFVCRLPKTTTLISIMDCCFSGTIYDLPHLYTTSFTTNNNNNRHVAKVVSISGCRDDQTSADAYINGNYEGAMTWSFINALANANYNVKLVNLVDNMRILLKNKYTQVPLLAVSSTDLYDVVFMDSVSQLHQTITRSIKFSMSIDYWFGESSWNVWSHHENKYILPTFNIFNQKYQTTQTTIALAPGSYKLVVSDTYGDGGVTSLVTDGLVTLVSATMRSGKLAEYGFVV